MADPNEATSISELLCPPHASLDVNGHLPPFDNCIACIRNERDELRECLEAISTDIAQDALEDPIGFTEREQAGYFRIAKGVRDKLNMLIEMELGGDHGR